MKKTKTTTTTKNGEGGGGGEEEAQSTVNAYIDIKAFHAHTLK